MKKRISTSWIVFCYLLFAGCTQYATKPASSEKSATRGDASSVIVKPGQTDMLLRYLQIFNAMSAEAQKREFASLSSQRRSEYSRMQLVLVQGLPGSRFRDLAKAMALLDEHLKAGNSKDEGLRNLANLLKTQLAEQQKLEDAIAQTNQKLKDEQIKSETLQRKIDELLEVEKTMTDRLRPPTK